MPIKKKIIIPKLSLLKLKLYYKHVLHLFYFLEKKQKTSFIIINNQGFLSFYLQTLIEKFKYNISLHSFKLNLSIFNYLLRKKKFQILNIVSYSIFFNFNYVLNIDNSLLFDKFFFDSVKKFNTNYVHFLYIKLIFFAKLIAFEFFHDFLEKLNPKFLYIKLFKLLFLHRQTLVKNLFVFCVKNTKKCISRSNKNIL
jgi:hypothetical protein